VFLVGSAAFGSVGLIEKFDWIVRHEGSKPVAHGPVAPRFSGRPLFGSFRFSNELMRSTNGKVS
jgi:hypothetical protein